VRRVISIALVALTVAILGRTLALGPRVRSVPGATLPWEPRLGEGGTLLASTGGVEVWREDEGHLVIERAGQHVSLALDEPAAALVLAFEGRRVVERPVVEIFVASRTAVSTPLRLLSIDEQGVREVLVPRPVEGWPHRASRVGKTIELAYATHPGHRWHDAWLWPWRRTRFTSWLPAALTPTNRSHMLFVHSTDDGLTWQAR
jgi:hypothetical protein